MNVEPDLKPKQTTAPWSWFDGAATSLGVRDLSPAGFSRALVWLALVGLVIRLGFFVEHSHSPSFGVPTLDQKYYDTVARMILAGEDLHTLHGFKPLLYPLQLAACYRLGGGSGIELAILLQHLLGVATGVLVAWLGAKLFRHRLAGIIGGFIFLIAPLPLSFEGELLVESTYTFLICLALLAHWTASSRRGWPAVGWWLAAGGLVALAAQERSNILVFAAVYPLLAVGRYWVSRKPEAGLPLLGLAGLLAVMLCWGLINYQQADHFQLIPGAGGVNLYLGNKRTATGMTAGQEKREAYTERYEDPMEVWSRQEYATAMRAQGLVPQDNPAAISSYWTHRAIEEIRADPGHWVKLMLKKTWLMAWNDEVPNNNSFAFEQQGSFWLRWLPVRWVWLFALAPIGFWAALKFGDRERLFMLAVFLLFYSAGVILFFISDRYRYPLWPAMSVLAGGAVVVLFQALARRKLGALAWMLAAMGLMAAISLPNWYAVQLPNFARDYLFRSMAWYDKGHYAEALADVDASLKLDATDTSAWQQRGNALIGLQRPAEACQAYQKALQLNPGEGTTWNNLGAALDMMGKTDDALAAFQHATKCEPPSRNALLGITFIRLRTGQLDRASEALAQYEQLGHAPDAISLALRSVVERRRGNLQTAADLEHQARTLDEGAAQWALDQVNRTSVR